MLGDLPPLFCGKKTKGLGKVAEWSYNTISHASTGISPFEAVYGSPPSHLLSYVKGTTQVQAVIKLLKEKFWK